MSVDVSLARIQPSQRESQVGRGAVTLTPGHRDSAAHPEVGAMGIEKVWRSVLYALLDTKRFQPPNRAVQLADGLALNVRARSKSASLS